MCDLRPFFSFYGGKWRIAPKYPLPLYDTVIEPFAGSAGYAIRHHTRNVILVERAPKIAATWRFLMNSTPADIIRLPDVEDGQTVDDLNVCEEAKYLIGWWLNHATTAPRKSPSKWMRLRGKLKKGYWGREIRGRIAQQIPLIRHWRLIEGNYFDAPDVEATWFIDPPYQDGGEQYVFSSNQIDYAELARWCWGTKGQTMVCERLGATWLPFVHLTDARTISSRNGTRECSEALWYREQVNVCTSLL